jgi:hypothetical protein
MNVIGLWLVAFNEIHHVDKIALGGDQQRLASRLLRKARRARIRDPNLNWAQATRTQLGAMRGNT